MKQRLKALRWKLYPYYSKIVAAVTFYILRVTQGKNELIILLHQYLGDQLYALSCLECILKEYSKKKITVMGPDNNAEILRTYQGIDRLVILPFKGIRYLAIQCLIRSNKYSERGLQYGIINATPIDYARFRDNKDENAREMLVKYIYKLKDNHPITYHNTPVVKVQSIDNFEGTKNKIVILNPYSFSTGYSKELFLQLCHILNERGYIVFTNVIGNQEAIKGSAPLRCDLAEFYSISRGVKLFISARSGIVDFVANSGVNMFIIYEQGKWVTDHYAMREWEPKGIFYEVVSTNENEVINAFKTFLVEVENEGC